MRAHALTSAVLCCVYAIATVRMRRQLLCLGWLVGCAQSGLLDGSRPSSCSRVMRQRKTRPSWPSWYATHNITPTYLLIYHHTPHATCHATCHAWRQHAYSICLYAYWTVRCLCLCALYLHIGGGPRAVDDGICGVLVTTAQKCHDGKPQGQPQLQQPYLSVSWD